MQHVEVSVRAFPAPHDEVARRTTILATVEVFKTYRSRGGARTSVLPDFFVDAQAAVLGAPLITRDIRRYRTHFPNLDLIARP